VMAGRYAAASEGTRRSRAPRVPYINGLVPEVAAQGWYRAMTTSPSHRCQWRYLPRCPPYPALVGGGRDGAGTTAPGTGFPLAFASRIMKYPACRGAPAPDMPDAAGAPHSGGTDVRLGGAGCGGRFAAGRPTAQCLRASRSMGSAASLTPRTSPPITARDRSFVPVRSPPRRCLISTTKAGNVGDWKLGSARRAGSHCTKKLITRQ
jgi:hypothetical protein